MLRRARGLIVLAAVGLLLSGCQPADSGASPDADPVPAGSTVGFYGDSLTFGVGASSPDLRWSSLLCASRGWTEVNPSIPGLGFVARRTGTDLPAELVAASPDLVIVALGHNDLWLVDQSGPAVQNAIETDLMGLRAALPDARIVVLALFIPLSFGPPQVTTVNGWLNAAADDVGATFVATSGEWLVDRPDWTVDGIHFSDLGNARIAELMDAELSRVL